MTDLWECSTTHSVIVLNQRTHYEIQADILLKVAHIPPFHFSFDHLHLVYFPLFLHYRRSSVVDDAFKSAARKSLPSGVALRVGLLFVAGPSTSWITRLIVETDLTGFPAIRYYLPFAPFAKKLQTPRSAIPQLVKSHNRTEFNSQ